MYISRESRVYCQLKSECVYQESFQGKKKKSYNTFELTYCWLKERKDFLICPIYLIIPEVSWLAMRKAGRKSVGKVFA